MPTQQAVELALVQEAGLFLARAVPPIYAVLAVGNLVALSCRPHMERVLPWWIQPGSQRLGLARAQALEQLESIPGQHLVIVRYAPEHDPLKDVGWVYNAADIDAAKVVWARQMDPQENLKLLRYFAGRWVWLVEPDKVPVKLLPYQVSSLQ